MSKTRSKKSQRLRAKVADSSTPEISGSAIFSCSAIFFFMVRWWCCGANGSSTEAKTPSSSVGSKRITKRSEISRLLHRLASIFFQFCKRYARINLLLIEQLNLDIRLCTVLQKKTALGYHYKDGQRDWQMRNNLRLYLKIKTACVLIQKGIEHR